MTELLCAKVERNFASDDKSPGRLHITLDALPEVWYEDWWVTTPQGLVLALTEADLMQGLKNDLIKQAQYIWRIRLAELSRRLPNHGTEPVALTEIATFYPKDTFRDRRQSDGPYWDNKFGMVNGFSLHTAVYNSYFQLSTAAIMNVVVHESKSVDGVWKYGFSLPVYTVGDLVRENAPNEWRIETDPELTNAYKIVRTSVQENQ